MQDPGVESEDTASGFAHGGSPMVNPDPDVIDVMGVMFGEPARTSSGIPP